MNKNKKVCGVDEAGRGSLIGPMVLAGVLFNKSTKATFKRLGVKDSKLLSKKRREELYKKIIDKVEYKIILISPKAIDKAVTGKYSTLNTLEAKKTVEIIENLKPSRVIIDCPSVNIAKYKRQMQTHLHSKVQLVPKHKADLNYIEVAAASILAKVTRDREIIKIKKKYKIEFGSGYPADSRTVKFLKECKGNYPIFRKSWATWKRFIQN